MRIILDYRPALSERTGVGEYVHEITRALAGLLTGAPADRVVAFSSSWKDRLDVSDLPDPFREGREVIVTVQQNSSGTFVGEKDSLITKCPSKYTIDPKTESR